MAGPKALNEDFVRSLQDNGPVVMVNLVRFRQRSLDGNGSGWDAYSRYSKGDMPLLKRVAVRKSGQGMLKALRWAISAMVAGTGWFWLATHLGRLS